MCWSLQGVLKAPHVLALKNRVVVPADSESLPLRRGRSIKWIEYALPTLNGRMSERDLRRLIYAIGATLGFETLVWLTETERVHAAAACECATRVADNKTYYVSYLWPIYRRAE
jgi:hypothetical protein